MDVYLSGEIHSDWRERIVSGARGLDVRFSSPVTDRIFHELAAATDLERRIALARDLQDAFHDEVAMVNLGFVYRLVARSDRVHDPLGNLALGNLTLHGVWLTP